MRQNPTARFAERIHADPERLALSDERGARTLTYGELGERVRAVAGWLAREGLGPGARVAVYGDRSAAAVTGILGAAWAGCAYVPISPSQPPPIVASILEQASPHAVIDATASGGTSLGAGSPVLDLDASGAPVAGGAESVAAPRALEPRALAYLMFTSGTPGDPKGVAVETASVARFLAAIQEYATIGPGQRVAQFAPLGFDLSVFEIFSALGNGASLHVVPERERMAPARFLRDREIQACLLVPSVGSLMARLGQLGKGSLSALRLSLFCGEPLPARLVRQWRDAAPGSEILNLYGPTEATVTCLFAPCRDALAETPERGWLAIGSPHSGVRAGIVDAEQRFLPRGEPGELALSGDQLSAGYWRDDARTRAAFRTLCHPRFGEARWYLTGDGAFEDEDGIFHFLGRLDNQIKVLGNRVELEGVDAHLRDVSGCERAGAVGWPVVDGSAQGIVAFVSQGAAEPAEILRRLESRVPAHMLPRRIVALDALPVTRNGKLDRRALVMLLERESAP